MVSKKEYKAFLAQLKSTKNELNKAQKALTKLAAKVKGEKYDIKSQSAVC